MDKALFLSDSDRTGALNEAYMLLKSSLSEFAIANNISEKEIEQLESILYRHYKARFASYIISERLNSRNGFITKVLGENTRVREGFAASRFRFVRENCN